MSATFSDYFADVSNNCDTSPPSSDSSCLIIDPSDDESNEEVAAPINYNILRVILPKINDYYGVEPSPILNAMDALMCNRLKLRSLRLLKPNYSTEIRIGKNFQAVCPPLVPESERVYHEEPESEPAYLLWKPMPFITDDMLDEYLGIALAKYKYQEEQAMAMFHWHEYNMDSTLADLPNFTPFPNIWSEQDMADFTTALRYYGKNFVRIQQMLPDKTIPALVLHYYLNKKSIEASSDQVHYDLLKLDDAIFRTYPKQREIMEYMNVAQEATIKFLAENSYNSTSF